MVMIWEKGIFLEVDSMVVSCWIVACLRGETSNHNSDLHMNCIVFCYIIPNSAVHH